MGSGRSTRLQRSLLGLLLLLASLAISLFPVGRARVIHSSMSERIITTRYGSMRGIVVEFPNHRLRPVVAYLGLRYGDLDGGGMRFMPPKNPKEQWNGVRVALAHQPACPQPNRHERDYSQQLPEARVAHLRNITPFLIDRKEDCLTLNLYVPRHGWNETQPKAVMVFIHGESYQTGTGNAYDGSVLASFGDVVVVTLNYRLGVLGFLNTGDHAALGNYALLDITQALLWLKENILLFNGDPQRVTLFGHGTGAALVNLLLMSPFVIDSRGNIFQRAIMQSGSASSTWAMSYDSKWCNNNLASKVNCSMHIGNSQALIHCLRTRSDLTLVNNAPEAPKYFSCFAPSIDSWTVLPYEVDKMVRKPDSKFATVPVMLGVTKNEAYAYLKQEDIRKGVPDSRKAQIIRTYVQNVFRYHRQKIYAILDHLYTDWTRPPDLKSNRDSILELLNDGQFVAPLMEMANIHSETADTYLYSFAYSTQSETPNDNDEDVQGIHGDELPYVFGAPLVEGVSPFPSKYTQAEKMLTEAMMTYWTNFAKSGNPNEPRNQTSVFGESVSNRFVNLKWPKYTKDKQEYLPIGRRPAIRSHYRAAKMAAWLDLIPKIDKAVEGEQPNQAAHLLDQWDNMSTFDDFHTLIPNMDPFPFPPPMPPVSPKVFQQNDVTWTPHYEEVTGDNSNPLLDQRPSRPEPKPAAVDTRQGHSANLAETTAEPPKPYSYKAGSGTGVPLSIVVAIGGSLLLINVIIFAGLCYQRGRIRKMRLLSKPLAVPDMDIDEIRLNRNLESNRSSPCPMGGGSSGAAPECISLMSGASAHQHTTSPMKQSQGGSTHVHNPSPQPSLHSRRGQSQIRVTAPSEPVVCNYTAVPTQVTSPVHRTHIGVSQGGTPAAAAHERGADMNTYVNSKVRPPLDSNHKGAADSVGVLSTFSPGPRPALAASATVSAPSVPNNQVAVTGMPCPPPPLPGATDDPLYKTINKTGQNNAVTIV